MSGMPRSNLFFRKRSSSRQSIMWLLGLLLLVFVAGMLLLSSLNLTYSREALSELRREQIEEVVGAGLARINARQSALASYTATLANVGESFQALAGDRYSGAGQDPLRSQLEQTLQAHLLDFDGASGAGLWFEPGVLATAGSSYMPYFVLNDDKTQRLDSESQFTRYRAAPWYSRTLTADWRPEPDQAGDVYWSPVYFDLNTKRAILTLASPMFDPDGRLLGMATTAWGADQVIELVSRISVTEHSFTFLNDRDNRNLSSLSQGEDTRREQAIIDAILALNLGDSLSAPPASTDHPPEVLTTRRLTIDGADYELYFAATTAGMVYGAGVPVSEINAVLLTMERTNRNILAGTVAAMLMLSLYLLYRIAQLIRELQASYTDQMTGLPNRVRLLRDLQAAAQASLLIVNLDRFKEINSLFGSVCGDQVLLAVTARLKNLRRKMSPERLDVYRLPGDEFAILMPQLAPEAIEELARQVRRAVTREQIYWQQQPLTVDISIGMAIRRSRLPDEPPDQLVSQAKIAVLQAREQSRHHRLYDPAVGVEENYESNLYWVNRLKTAIAQDWLVPWFQPIHDNHHERVNKYECLVRMVEPDGDVANAGQFVEIAGRLRFNGKIARMMVDKCFAFFRNRDEAFSINLSYGDIAESETLTHILDALEQTGIGDRVIFEILESDGIENYAEIRSFIDRVKAYGCRIAIDDFGTGYSNFAHLLSLNVDFIKIDGSLIRHLDTDRTAYLVTSGIVQFARSLEIQTVAEFVHSEAIQRCVRELGIDYSQGQYFGLATANPD